MLKNLPIILVVPVFVLLHLLVTKRCNGGILADHAKLWHILRLVSPVQTMAKFGAAHGWQVCSIANSVDDVRVKLEV